MTQHRPKTAGIGALSRRQALASLGALAAVAGPMRAWAETAGEPAKPPKLVETPMFEPLVKEGKLPPIAKRVPAAPLIVKLEGDKKPGAHGGDLRLLMSKDRDARFVGSYGYARLVCWTPDGQLVPDIAESIEADDAEKTFTIKLRKGHRWSDGKPFTSADFKFFWEDMAGNKALARFFGATSLLVDGEKPKVEFEDKQLGKAVGYLTEQLAAPPTQKPADVDANKGEKKDEKAGEAPKGGASIEFYRRIPWRPGRSG